MILTKPSIEIENINGVQILKNIEKAGRICYKSEEKITENSYIDFINKILNRDHLAVIEHEKVTVKIICDRGCCYDDKTEVLTEKGWRLFKDIKKIDRVACLDDEGVLRFYKPDKIISKDYEGDMLEFKCNTLDLLVTPNHNMWVFDYDKRSKDTRTWKFIQADKLLNSRYRFLKGGVNWLFKKDVEISIPKHRTKFKQFPKLVLNKYQVGALFELLGWWITDGSYNQGHRYNSGDSVIISQVKQIGRKRIMKLCEDIGLPFSFNNKEISIDNGRFSDFVKSIFGDGAKTFTSFVPEIIKNSSLSQISRFLKGVVGGDGNIHKKNGHIVVYTSSKQFADDLQELFLRVGMSANIRVIAPRFRKGIQGEKSFTSKISYVVSVHKESEVLLDKRCAGSFGKKVKYKGKVYCLTVPHHRLYVRRNGKPIWCGNSHEIVRHRIASYCQESTRYCNYKGGVEFIIPEWCKDIEAGEYSSQDLDKTMRINSNATWFISMLQAESHYKSLLAKGWTPQQARSVLPNSLKTEIVMTANLREWIHFFKLRTSKAAHPDMIVVAKMILEEFKKQIPIIFDKI